MEKKNFIHVIDSFKPDDNLKYRIQRKVEDEMRKQEYQERQVSRKSTHRGRKVAIFSACLVAVMGVSMAMPVMADNTSIFENLVAKIQERNEVNPTKDYAVKVTESTTIPKDTQVVDDTQPADIVTYEHCITPYVDSYYCDGNSLYITYGIKANAEDLAQCNCIFGGMDIKINGQSLDNGGKSTNTFTASSDELGLFVGKINLDVSDIENLEGARVDIDFNVCCAFDDINYDFNYDELCYEQRTRVDDKKEYLEDIVSFGFDITETNPQLDVYEVNQTQEGNTLNSVTVSPAKTEISLDCQDGYYVRLYDSTGKELLWDCESDNTIFETPMIGATSITVNLYNDTQSEPVYSFEVPIERGFNTGLDVENGQCYIDVEPVYNPPQNEILPLVKEKAEEEFKDIPKVGEKSYEYSDDEYGFNLTIDGYTIADNFDGLQLDTNMSDLYIDENGNISDGYKAVIVDATITSTIDTEQSFYRQFSLDSGANIFNCFNEPIAFDNYENYYKSSYVITLQPNETRNMKIGFIISEDALQLPIVCQLNGYNHGDDAYTIRLQ